MATLDENQWLRWVLLLQMLQSFVVLGDDEHFVGQPELLVLRVPRVEEIDVAVVNRKHHCEAHSACLQVFADRRWADAKVVLTPLGPRHTRKCVNCEHGTSHACMPIAPYHFAKRLSVQTSWRVLEWRVNEPVENPQSKHCQAREMNKAIRSRTVNRATGEP